MTKFRRIFIVKRILFLCSNDYSFRFINCIKDLNFTLKIFLRSFWCVIQTFRMCSFDYFFYLRCDNFWLKFDEFLFSNGYFFYVQTTIHLRFINCIQYLNFTIKFSPPTFSCVIKTFKMCSFDYFFHLRWHNFWIKFDEFFIFKRILFLCSNDYSITLYKL